MYMYVWVCVCVCTCMCVYVCVFVCVYVCVCGYRYVLCIYIYIYAAPLPQLMEERDDIIATLKAELYAAKQVATELRDKLANYTVQAHIKEVGGACGHGNLRSWVIINYITLCCIHGDIYNDIILC